jgi:hypothetical protein
VLLYSREWLESRCVTVGGSIQLCIPQYQVRGEGRVVAIKPATTVPQGEGLLLSLARQPGKNADANLPPVEQREWQQVHIVLDEPGDKRVYVVILHSKEWLRLRKRLIIGGPIFLNLPQYKVYGEGRLLLIEPSPLISDDEGRVMTITRGPRRALNVDLSLRPGIRTYFGERVPPIGHQWVRLEFNSGGVMSEFMLTRTEEWMRANWQAVEELRKVEESHKDEEIPPEISQWRLIRMSVAVQEGRQFHLAFFWKRQWVEAHGLTVDEPVYMRRSKEQLFGEGRLIAIDPAPFAPRKGEPKASLWISGKQQDGDDSTIDSAEVGDYAVTYTAEERGEEPSVDDTQGEWISRVRIHLHLDKEGGGDVSIVLLREMEWVEAEGINEGGKVYLDMPEQGTIGWATVKAVVPCLVFRRLGNPGIQMITGTFRHSEGWAGDLVLKGESKPIGVTPGHLFWSVDRQEWVPVGELQPGETVKTLKGTTTVVSYTMRDGPEPVYNWEIERDHVYRVGDLGILVHNTSNPTAGGPQVFPALTGKCADISSFSNDSSTPLMLGVSPVGHGLPVYSGGPTQGVLVSGSQQARLISGQTNPGKWLQQASILVAQSWYHVEGHAVSIMVQCCIMKATLYINQKPCEGRPAYCQTTIPRALPKGWVLEVVFENDDHTTTRTGRFIGGVGWQEP